MSRPASSRIEYLGNSERVLGRPQSGLPRLLFLTWATLGITSYAKEIATYTATRDDVECVHILLRLQGLDRVLATGRVRGTGLIHPAVRQRLLMRRAFAGFVRNLSANGRLSAAHVLPTSLSHLALAGGFSFPFSLGLDTTPALRGAGEDASGYMRRIDGRAYRRAAFLAPWSEMVGNSLVDDYGISPERVLVTPPAVTRRGNCQPVPHATRPRLMFIGNDWERKGGPELLRWHTRHFAGRAELHVFGSVPDRARVSHADIVFHGPIPREELLSQWLPSATALVLPSRREMAPLVIAEAMMAGIPMVATAVGSIPEMVIDGETGYLLHEGSEETDFVAAITRLLDAPDAAAKMGDAARARAQREYEPVIVYGRLIDRLVAEADRSDQQADR